MPSRIQHENKPSQEKEAGDVALAELVNYVFETQRNSDVANAFRLADLSNMYEKRVQQLSEGTIPIRRTRLKEMLLAKIPDLQAYTKGREVLLVFEKDVGPAIALACNYDDTIHIGKTAEIIWTQIKEHKTKFSGSFSAEDTQSSVPTSLLELVCMIEHGPDIQSRLENSVCKSDLAIAQLLMYNYHAKTPKVSEQQRHAHPSDDISGIERGDLILGNRSNSRQVSSLPDTYANVRPAYLKTKPKPPNSPDTILKLLDHDYLKQSLQSSHQGLSSYSQPNLFQTLLGKTYDAHRADEDIDALYTLVHKAVVNNCHFEKV
ncbi:unnamed protein product [Mytilus coruscus]|uniref:Uncharacterized protein n=1 Tax=Mytilus coruscus TaxID=42192 RepID=A0A6J8BPJ7_MYTCO|nr:unnamed protein product [Mytilus coruscus]